MLLVVFTGSSFRQKSICALILNSRAFKTLKGTCHRAFNDSTELPLSDRTVAYSGQKYKWIPGDSVQRIWKSADRTLKKATALFYSAERNTSAK